MKIEQLKFGLFGFQRESVFRYISAIEEEFSAKLSEKDAQLQKSEAEYLERIHTLEQTTRAQLEQQRNTQLLLSKAMADLRRTGSAQTQNAEEQFFAAQQLLQQQLAEKDQALAEQQAQLRQLREMVQMLRQVSESEEKFAAKLMEKNTSLQKREAEQLKEIRQLEAELRSAKEQLEQQENDQMLLAQALCEAQDSANQAKQQTRRAQTQPQRDFEDDRAQMQQIQQMYRSILKNIDETAPAEKPAASPAAAPEALNENVEAAPRPQQNLSLFSRKKEPVA